MSVFRQDVTVNMAAEEEEVEEEEEEVEEEEEEAVFVCQCVWQSSWIMRVTVGLL